MSTEQQLRDALKALQSQPSQSMPKAGPELPFDVEFAASYLDGVMEGEQEEIRSKWAKIRRHLSASPAAPEGAKPEPKLCKCGMSSEAPHICAAYPKGNPAQLAAKPEQTSGDHDFKNFHRLLCERFDYVHDEKDWKRDQLSLIEWIAKKVATPTAELGGERAELTPEYLADLVPAGVVVMEDEHGKPRGTLFSYPQLKQFAAALLAADGKAGEEAVAKISNDQYGEVNLMTPDGETKIAQLRNPAYWPLGTTFYTRPQQAAQVPLTEEQVTALRAKHGWAKETIREIEAAIRRERE